MQKNEILDLVMLLDCQCPDDEHVDYNCRCPHCIAVSAINEAGAILHNAVWDIFGVGWWDVQKKLIQSIKEQVDENSRRDRG